MSSLVRTIHRGYVPLVLPERFVDVRLETALSSTVDWVEMGGGMTAAASFELSARCVDPPFSVRVLAELEKDRYLAHKVSVTADDGSEISSETLRGVPVAELIAHVARSCVGLSELDAPEWMARLGRWPTGRDVSPGPTDDVLSMVAFAYRAGRLAGHAPVSFVAEQLEIPKRRATDWIGRARSLGMLPATTRGRSAG